MALLIFVNASIENALSEITAKDLKFPLIHLDERIC